MAARPKDMSSGITTTDLMEMRRLWDENAWPRATHRFKFSAPGDCWELWHQPSNTKKFIRNDQGDWVAP